MWVLATFAIVFLTLCVAVADRSKVAEYRSRMNVWAKPLSFVGIGLLLVLILLR